MAESGGTRRNRGSAGRTPAWSWPLADAAAARKSQQATDGRASRQSTSFHGRIGDLSCRAALGIRGVGRRLRSIRLSLRQVGWRECRRVWAGPARAGSRKPGVRWTTGVERRRETVADLLNRRHRGGRIGCERIQRRDRDRPGRSVREVCSVSGSCSRVEKLAAQTRRPVRTPSERDPMLPRSRLPVRRSAAGRSDRPEHHWRIAGMGEAIRLPATLCVDREPRHRRRPSRRPRSRRRRPSPVFWSDRAKRRYARYGELSTPAPGSAATGFGPSGRRTEPAVAPRRESPAARA